MSFIRPTLQSFRLIAPSTSRTSLLHTSSVLQGENPRKRIARAVRKANIEKKAQREKSADLNKPSVVLGIRPGEEGRWENCDLAKILVDQAALATPPEDYQPLEAHVGTINVPRQTAWGVGEKEQSLLFQTLPMLTANHVGKPGADKVEHDKANKFARLIDLRNADAGGIAFENRRRIVAAFSTPANPFDTGRPEVQAALLTYKIRKLWGHLDKFRRDVGNRRSLRKLVHQRAKILKYLKRLDRDRYDIVLSRLALEPESVEGELIV